MAFSRDWFSHNIPRWERWFAEFKGRPGLRFLEIGSFEGCSTTWLLENVLTGAGSTIECVDLFEPDPNVGEYLPRFRENVAPWASQVVERKGPSEVVLKQLSGPYDMIYVDGLHTAYGALSDGVLAWPLLKVGGLMVFDDYLWVPHTETIPTLDAAEAARIESKGGSVFATTRLKVIERMPARTPKLGIDSLLATLEGYCALVESDYQIAVRKTRAFGRSALEIDT